MKLPQFGNSGRRPSAPPAPPSSSSCRSRIAITPIDTLKTTLQVHGSVGLSVLWERIAAHGILTLWAGWLETSLATFAGHYPWFATYNYMKADWPEPKGKWVNASAVY